MNTFNFKVPQEIIFGQNKIDELENIAKKDKLSKLFIISDRGIEKAGIVEKVENVLSKAKINYSDFLDVVANPTVDCVEAAYKKYTEFGAECIVALGGGSSMDVAKAVGILASHGGKITEYEGSFIVPGPIVPLIAIPTTAGTGSEVTAAAVITDTTRNWKFSVFSYYLLPKYAILDPNMITGLPFQVAAATGVDALVHAIEAYISLNKSPFSDAMAEKAMELIGNNLRQFVSNRNNIDAASAMLIGSMFAGISFSWARLGNVHAMSHPVSAYFGVPHGVANAILLPYILKYNALSDEGRYEKIYNYIKKDNIDGQFKKQTLINEVFQLLEDLRIPFHLSEVGVTNEFFEQMADDTMKSGNYYINPRANTRKDILDIYNEAL